MNRVVMPTNGQHARWDGVRSLSTELIKEREAALNRAQNAVQSTRFGALMLEIAAWLQSGQWTAPQDDLVRDRGDLPIAVFAAEQLTRRWRKLRKKGKAPAQLDARGRHELRIRTKKRRRRRGLRLPHTNLPNDPDWRRRDHRCRSPANSAASGARRRQALNPTHLMIRSTSLPNEHARSQRLRLVCRRGRGEWRVRMALIRKSW